MKLIWFGHSCFRIETGNSILLIVSHTFEFRNHVEQRHLMKFFIWFAKRDRVLQPIHLPYIPYEPEKLELLENGKMQELKGGKSNEEK